MNLNKLNNLPSIEAKRIFEQCCTASGWVQKMIERRPFDSIQTLKLEATNIWNTMHTDDLLEAFSGHPKIGHISSLKAKFHNTLASASKEQSGIESASDSVLEELTQYNKDYEDKFGFIFIVFASGKSAEEMLDIIKTRIHNAISKEILIAADEQLKITQLRLDRLIKPK
ncbi:MAG: 2-oxo-4-hydroxy-4-carboxy-5-ureidoimidazoline decarboxylase [Gammaproteobacteria bacterium]|nr:2-oxo-4-hydroxy-4-carboxy-5-ureidoimidazoline decarboxylase [Gammaproteobacteria bacterium]